MKLHSSVMLPIWSGGGHCWRGSGPLIGRWDAQEGVPIRGEAPLRASTWHSIELQARYAIPEWDGKEASCRQEEEAYVAEDGTRDWVFRRQTKFPLVW